MAKCEDYNVEDGSDSYHDSISGGKAENDKVQTPLVSPLDTEVWLVSILSNHSKWPMSPCPFSSLALASLFYDQRPTLSPERRNDDTGSNSQIFKFSNL